MSDRITVDGLEYRIPREILSSGRRFTIFVSAAGGTLSEVRRETLRSFPRRAAPPYPARDRPPQIGWVVWVHTEDGGRVKCEPTPPLRW